MTKVNEVNDAIHEFEQNKKETYEAFLLTPRPEFNMSSYLQACESIATLSERLLQAQNAYDGEIERARKNYRMYMEEVRKCARIKRDCEREVGAVRFAMESAVEKSLDLARQLKEAKKGKKK